DKLVTGVQTCALPILGNGAIATLKGYNGPTGQAEEEWFHAASQSRLHFAAGCFAAGLGIGSGLDEDRPHAGQRAEVSVRRCPVRSEERRVGKEWSIVW